MFCRCFLFILAQEDEPQMGKRGNILVLQRERKINLQLRSFANSLVTAYSTIQFVSPHFRVYLGFSLHLVIFGEGSKIKIMVRRLVLLSQTLFLQQFLIVYVPRRNAGQTS